jgi:4-amino-4-deoxy-L-arabinose transferase-like glycosyltransferase
MKQLLFILLLALGFRLFQFGTIPHGINRDEAAIGYTAYLLLHTGKDEHQRSWPLKFESFGDWKQPGYIYLTLPFVWLLGLTEQSVRLPSLLFGLLMILAAYSVTNQLVYSRNQGKAGLGAALLLAINPWHFHFSHLAVEPMVAAALVSISLWLLWNKNNRLKLGGLVGLVVTFITYHASLIVVPLWFLGYLWFTRVQKRTPLFTITAIALLFFIGVNLMQSWNSDERVKVRGTTIFSQSNEELWNTIYQYRTSGLPSLLIHNRYTYSGKTIITNYFKTYSPEFLFYKGGTHPHYNVPGFGNFYFAEIILAIAGVIIVLIKRKRLGYLILWLIILAPLPAAITKDGVHSTREIFLLPGIQIVAAYGGYVIWHQAKLKRSLPLALTMAGLLLTLIIQSGLFIRYYWTDYTFESDLRFTGYFKQFSHDLIHLQQDFSTILVTFPFESPYIFYAFYTSLQPELFFDTIEYYPKDALGFVYAKRLGNMIYPENVTKAKSMSVSGQAPVLLIAREAEVDAEESLFEWADLSGNIQLKAFSH